MDLMTNHIAKIICDTDLPNSNGFGTVRLNKKEAEILAAKLVSGLYPQDNLVVDFEQQLKTEKAKYSLAVECYRDVYNKLQRIETGKSDFVWHKTADGEFPENVKKCYVAVWVKGVWVTLLELITRCRLTMFCRNGV